MYISKNHLAKEAYAEYYYKKIYKESLQYSGRDLLRRGALYAVLAITLAIILAKVLTVVNTTTAYTDLSVMDELRVEIRAESKIVEPVSMLDGAKPVGINASLVDNKQLPSLIEELGLRLSFEPTGAQVFYYGDREILVILPRLTEGVSPQPLVVDLNTGEVLRSKLVVIKHFEFTEPITNISGVVGPSESWNAAYGNYTVLRAVNVVRATSYVLLVALKGPTEPVPTSLAYDQDSELVPLAYYIYISQCYSWLLLGREVFSVCAAGIFYVDPGNAVYLLYDYSDYNESPPFAGCEFHRSRNTTPVSDSVRADGVAAAMLCPVTTKLTVWAIVGVDKWGGTFSNGDGSKTIAIGCGCFAP